MATKDLKNLIQCSGYAGIAGQSFRNNVLGAASGAKMTDYNISGWPTFTSSPAAQGAPMPAFDSGQVFQLSATLYGGSRMSYITRAGSGLATVQQTGTIPNGSGATVTSNIVTNTPGVNVAPIVGVNLQVTSGYNTGAVPGVVGNATMSPDGVNDGQPADGTGPAYMHFTAAIQGGNGISDGYTDDLNFLITFDPNTGTGHFNDPLSQTFTVRMRHRGYAQNDFTIEWHTNSSYTSSSYLRGDWSFMLSEATYMPSGPGTYSLWLRYKQAGTSTWTNYGQVDCVDSRIMY